MPFVAVRDLQMYYEIRGTGPRLLSISGTGGDLRRSPNIFEIAIARYFEILAYDQRGLGQTSRPDIPIPWLIMPTIQCIARSVRVGSLLRNGHLLRGMVAQEFALRYAHRVERLVLVSTSSGGKGGASYPLHEFVDLQSRTTLDVSSN